MNGKINRLLGGMEYNVINFTERMVVKPRKMVVSSGKMAPYFPITGAIESVEIIKQLYKDAEAEEKERKCKY